METYNYIESLHKANLKATPARLEILSVLEKSSKPLNAKNIQKLTKDKNMDMATTYRSLESLKKIGIIKQVNLQKDQAFYEISNKFDHHHLICQNCGIIEDFVGCYSDTIIKKALTGSKQFSKISEHSLELFGICNKCTKKV